MNLFKYNRHYESDLTGLINELKRQDPDLEKKQREARAIWWDKPPINLEEFERTKKSEVRAKPYAYD